jgi:excinuclease UvrABC ATPase subunit
MKVGRCQYCDGKGIELYYDRLGNAMTSYCRHCDGKGFTREFMAETAKEKLTKLVEDACDMAWENNWEN